MSDTNEPVWIEPAPIQRPSGGDGPVEPQLEPEPSADGAGTRDGGGRMLGIFRGATREVEVDVVVRDGDIYVQDDGRFVYVLSNGNGTSSVVILEGPSATDELVTVIESVSDSSLSARVDSGRWTPSDEL